VPFVGGLLVKTATAVLKEDARLPERSFDSKILALTVHYWQ
jgi:hypothetical protein